MSILVVAEQREGQLRKAAKEAVCTGRVLADQIGVGLSVLLVGDSVSGLVSEVSRCGAQTVYLAEETSLGIAASTEGLPEDSRTSGGGRRGLSSY